MDVIKGKTTRKIFDLVLNEEAGGHIGEVFGMPEDTRHQITEKFMKWLAFEEHNSFTSAWGDFLESDVFKKIGWEPKTQSDYFALGYCFSGGMMKYREKMGCKRGSAGLLDLLLK